MVEYHTKEIIKFWPLRRIFLKWSRSSGRGTHLSLIGSCTIFNPINSAFVAFHYCWCCYYCESTMWNTLLSVAGGRAPTHLLTPLQFNYNAEHLNSTRYHCKKCKQTTPLPSDNQHCIFLYQYMVGIGGWVGVGLVIAICEWGRIGCCNAEKQPRVVLSDDKLFKLFCLDGCSGMKSKWEMMGLSLQRILVRIYNGILWNQVFNVFTFWIQVNLQF